jgi:hypothetical protein
VRKLAIAKAKTEGRLTKAREDEIEQTIEVCKNLCLIVLLNFVKCACGYVRLSSNLLMSMVMEN